MPKGLLKVEVSFTTPATAIAGVLPFYSMKEEILQLIKNLRRGHNLEKSRIAFFKIIPVITSRKQLHLFTIRELISIVDTYADHGSLLQRSNATIITAFFNCIKISDTFLQYSTITKTDTVPESNGVFHLYDGVNSLRIAYDDMPSVLFFRIYRTISTTPILLPICREIINRLKQNSKTLQLASKQNPLFFEPEFFPGRKNFLGLEYPDNDLVKQLDF